MFSVTEMTPKLDQRNKKLIKPRKPTSFWGHLFNPDPIPLLKYFKDTYTHEERHNEFIVGGDIHDGKIMICVERFPYEKKLPAMERVYYVMHKFSRLNLLRRVLCDKMKADSEDLLLFTEDGTMPSINAPIFDLYMEHRDWDGFLYFYYSSEKDSGQKLKNRWERRGYEVCRPLVPEHVGLLGSRSSSMITFSTDRNFIEQTKGD
uniref:Microtubule-associated proteins 1A/1B light chain 3B n=1 Tax=Pseudodiaptomus poplesia TaxID=213370 RepID=A0A0U2V7H4_9MAXI|nr:microtubule-associated proteins 1A/1B light chain 3B [Pseudodiaptomus poplesia]